MLFSHRQGLVETRLEPQLESMDGDLRNGLWNVFYELVVLKARQSSASGEFMRMIWTEYYKQARDDFPRDYASLFKQRFMEGPWHEVYDLVELVAASHRNAIAAVNRVLERDNAGYRLIEAKVTPIIDELELSEVNSTLGGAEAKFRLAREHIARAVELFSDRESPDYRNAIKESISGAESAACVLTGEKNFKDALKGLKERGLHPVLAAVFSKLYGYTSDESGVRHALTEDATVGEAEAHYMIVSCSAFVSYLMQLG